MSKMEKQKQKQKQKDEELVPDERKLERVLTTTCST